MLMLCVTITATDDKPAVSNGEIKFYVDVSIFKENEQEDRIEFSIMLYSDQLVKKNNMIEYKAVLKIYNEDMNLKRNWITESDVSENENSVFNSLIINDSWTEIVKKGSYNYELLLVDVNSSKEGICNSSIQIENNSDKDISASSIKFFNGRESKNNKLELTGNAARQFGILNPLLYLYYEIYNNSQSIQECEIIYNIKNSFGQIVKSFPSKNQSIKNEKTIIGNALNVASIPEGVYGLETLLLSVVNQKELLKFSREFEVIQFNKNNNSQFENNEIIESITNIFPYIASKTELVNYNSLNKNSRVKYIIEYLKKSDTDNDPNKNEYLVDLYNKYLYANENFSWGGFEGWKSDRGRVLITYGIPDEILNFFYEDNINPYTVWRYESQRQYEFIFGDLRGDGRFTLIHSNKESEVSNTFWKDNLVKAK